MFQEAAGSQVQRGIDVVLELDTPGHQAALAYSHPQHVACLEGHPWSAFAVQPPAGQLRFANEHTAAFIASIFRESISLLRSPYFHAGGDELNVHCMVGDSFRIQEGTGDGVGRGVGQGTAGRPRLKLQMSDKPTLQALKAKGWSLDDALRDFTNRTHSTILEQGRTPVVWQEMVSR